MVALVVLLFRSPPNLPPAATRVGERPVLELQTGDTALSDEEALLRDKSPLFLPTEWNARTNVLPPEAVGEPGGTFAGYPAHDFFPEETVQVALPPPVEIPEQAVETLAVGAPKAPFFGMGRAARTVTPLPARDAFVEVVEEGSGTVVLQQRLEGLSLPESGTWAPIDFMVVVDSAGLVGRPVLFTRSGADQIDSFFQQYLARVLRVGERLVPGLYRVRVAP